MIPYGYVCHHCAIVATNADETTCDGSCLHDIPALDIVGDKTDDSSGFYFLCWDCGGIFIGAYPLYSFDN